MDIIVEAITKAATFLLISCGLCVAALALCVLLIVLLMRED